MTKAFLFGKFLPFHKGHEAMIRFALTQCDFLSILVCCSDQESIPSAVRCSWIRETFENESRMEVQKFEYLESELTNTSESSETVSKQWSEIFKKLFPDYSLVISSEAYGNFVAQFMNISHLAFDLPRKTIPVSATAIRNNLAAHWNFLPDRVKPYYAIKVVLLGTESTGKSTLTQKLASYFQCSYVAEAGRDLISDSKDFSYTELERVAEAHAQKIDEAVAGNSPLVIIDTDLHITQSYAKFIFQRELRVSAAIEVTNKADLYLYLNNDVTYFQDGTRLDESDRNQLDLSHRQVLNEHKIEFVEISGSWEERFEKAVQEIKHLLNKKMRH